MASLRSALDALAPLSESEWCETQTLVTGRTLRRGEVWQRAGDPVLHFGFVVEGLLQKHYVKPNGDEATRGFSREGDWAGAYAAVLQSTPSPLTTVALETSRIVELQVAGFRERFGRDRWERRARVMAEQALVERDWREHWLLTMRPPERYDEVLRQMPWLSARVSQRLIASYLGITPVSLSRIRGRRRAADGGAVR